MSENYLPFAKRLAIAAGEIMRQHFLADISYHEKDDGSLTTAADDQINDMVIAEIAKAFPAHSVLGEERSADHGSDFVWVCDPIDGTIPYRKGIPIATFSLALVREGNPIAGVIYDPHMQRLYSAEQGRGAYLNDKKIHVSQTGLTRHAIVNSTWWFDAEHDIDTPLHQLSLDTDTYVTNLGSLAFVNGLVAAGQYEASVYAGTTGKYVDVAASKVIVEEAGGRTSDLFGHDQRYDRDIQGSIMSNGVIHDELVRCISKYIKE